MKPSSSSPARAGCGVAPTRHAAGEAKSGISACQPASPRPAYTRRKADDDHLLAALALNSGAAAKAELLSTPPVAASPPEEVCRPKFLAVMLVVLLLLYLVRHLPRPASKGPAVRPVPENRAADLGHGECGRSRTWPAAWASLHNLHASTRHRGRWLHVEQQRLLLPP